MLYEITQDCRIANKDYEKGQLVSKEEVGGVFFSVMQEAQAKENAPEKAEKTAKKSSKKEKKAESDEETPAKQENSPAKQENTPSEEAKEENQNS